jgi:lipopolysaccharide transport system ATP-binding protein
MSDIAIRVQGLGKSYRIGQRECYHSLRDTLMQGLSAPFRWLRRTRGGHGHRQAPFWALKDVSFEVPTGQVIGIIGRNGAGKSTLLKILSRITEPTEGAVHLRGRVGSLLEVGTGFHPELTGRENIYLNGAILGMSRAEITRKFDEIVDFAEVDKFLDTPVKHYSSGMYMRLAFAVAAHLEPEVLLVDEVLAVGDVAFQQKCLGKMGAVAKQGRTVLFVSHNLAAVTALCQNALLLKEGHLASKGHAPEVINEYQKAVLLQRQTASVTDTFFSEAHAIGITNLQASLAKNEDGALDLTVQLDVISKTLCRRVGVGFRLHTLYGVRVSTIAPMMTNYVLDSVDGKTHCTLRCHSISHNLAGGEYMVDVWLSRPRIETLLAVDNALRVSIPFSDPYNCGMPYRSDQHGLVALRTSFEAQCD